MINYKRLFTLIIILITFITSVYFYYTGDIVKAIFGLCLIMTSELFYIGNKIDNN